MSNHWTPVTGLKHWAKSQPEKVYLSQPCDGEVKDYTWAMVDDEASRIASYIQQHNLPAGSRIAVLSKNCAQFIIADLAIWMAGHVSVPIYPSLTHDTLSYIFEHSESELLFLGELDDWKNMRLGIPATIPTVLFQNAPETDLPVDSKTWQEVIQHHSPSATVVERDSEELARLVYTSGSTGQPKGVMCPFRALETASRLFDHIVDIGPEDRMLSYLPLAHVFETAVVEVNSLRLGFQIFFNEGLSTFSEDIQRCRPTIFISVPRLWVKFQQMILAAIPQNELSQQLQKPDTARDIQQKLLEKLGLQEARIAFSGSAPLSASVLTWYKALGLELLEGYGMSEDFAYSHISRPGQARPGYVGHANPGVKRRISEDGEVQIQSPGDMLGYFKDKQATQSAYTDDGWFKTGDLGEVDEAGRLKITGRVKEIFKTAKGKYVAPSPIERKLNHPFIEVVCVTGPGRPQPFALLMPHSSPSSDVHRDKLSQEIETLFVELNETLAPHERLEFVVIVNDTWTIESGLLTPTMKIKRSALEDFYSEQVDGWYSARKKVIWL